MGRNPLGRALGRDLGASHMGLGTSRAVQISPFLPRLLAPPMGQPSVPQVCSDPPSALSY